MTTVSLWNPLTIPRTAIIHTRLVHDVHRRATSLLAASACSSKATADTLNELRGFVVSEMRYHHQSEDEFVWPVLRAANPAGTEALRTLAGEHRQLDCALDLLDRVIVGPAGDTHALTRVADTVRDLVHQHLDREEPVVFPLLAAHVSDARWRSLASRIVAGAPTDHAHLMVGLLEEVGSPKRVAQVLAHLPGPARLSLPDLRARAQETLACLRAA
jgi:hemerythrin-like domain-containing protein